MISLAYVYELVAFGKPDDVKNVFQELRKCFLLKTTGQVNDDGVKCLGKIPQAMRRHGAYLWGQGVF